MKFETFALERQQSIWENKVDYNLSESGVHPGSLNSLFDKKFVDEINNTELTYGFTEGSLGLRTAIADIYEALTAADRPYKDGKKLSQAMRIMGFMKKDYEIDEELLASFLKSGVYKQYAEKYLGEDQLDEIDEAAALA